MIKLGNGRTVLICVSPLCDHYWKALCDGMVVLSCQHLIHNNLINREGISPDFSWTSPWCRKLENNLNHLIKLYVSVSVFLGPAKFRRRSYYVLQTLPELLHPLATLLSMGSISLSDIYLILQLLVDWFIFFTFNYLIEWCCCIMLGISYLLFC